ncbi:MAG: hypothetical protein DI604_20195 [Delftia acidovorans]|nr:MAG: hypothetical protein DI604_20195 [Delftia acidovorans]
MTGPLTLSADPASALQAATKQYVDGLLLNMGRRSRVRVATTGNITISTALNSGDVIDGVTLENGDLVLVKDQTTASQNGVYVVSASPARSIEFDAWDEFPGALIGVAEGTSNDNTLWFCTSNTGGTLGTTSITFTQFRVAGELLAANNLSDLANAVTARTNLGLTIGSQVQAWSQKLTDIAGSTPALGDILVWNGTNFVPQAPSGGGMSLPGGMTKDPRLLPLFDSTNSVSVLISGTATNPDVNGFWDGIASRGAVANTATDNNFTTIVNITSGRGLLFNVIPPRHTNLNDVVTFRLTVDGEVYSITRSGPWAISNQYGRVILGQLLDQNSDPLSSSPTNPFLQSPASTTYFNTGSAGTLPKPPYMMALGMPMLLFEESLKVEVMCSDVFPTLNGPKSGVVYTLMG